MSSPLSLYVVVFEVRNAVARGRVRRILDSCASRVSRSSYELSSTAPGVRNLMRALESELQFADVVRIYPVCQRCKASVRLFGGEQLASTPAAYFV